MGPGLAGLAHLLLWLGLGLPWQGGTPDLEEAAPTDDAEVLDARALRSMSLDLLGRPPFAAERNAWIGRPAAAFVDDCLASEEFWSSWVEEQLYYFLLIDNFRPRSERVSALPASLHSGSMGVQEALHVIALCASFDRRNPGPDTFVTVVMEQFLGLEVQRKVHDLEAGKRMYDGRMGSFLGERGRSQSDVVRIALEDKRTLPHLLAREHQRLLRSPAARRELSAWARALAKGEQSFAQIMRTWLLSEAYRERLEAREEMTNRVFVQALYVDLSDARPALAEARRLRNALDGLSTAGPLRSVIARLFIDSGRATLPAREEIPDPTEWVGDMFERLLGRSPSQGELEVFVEAFHDPACSPGTIAYALVSHPEYQIW